VFVFSDWRPNTLANQPLFQKNIKCQNQTPERFELLRMHQKLDKASVLSIFMQKLGLVLQFNVKYKYINSIYKIKKHFPIIFDSKKSQ